MTVQEQLDAAVILYREFPSEDNRVLLFRLMEQKRDEFWTQERAEWADQLGVKFKK